MMMGDGVLECDENRSLRLTQKALENSAGKVRAIGERMLVTKDVTKGGPSWGIKNDLEGLKRYLRMSDGHQSEVLDKKNRRAEGKEKDETVTELFKECFDRCQTHGDALIEDIRAEMKRLELPDYMFEMVQGLDDEELVSWTVLKLLVEEDWALKALKARNKPNFHPSFIKLVTSVFQTLVDVENKPQSNETVCVNAKDFAQCLNTNKDFASFSKFPFRWSKRFPKENCSFEEVLSELSLMAQKLDHSALTGERKLINHGKSLCRRGQGNQKRLTHCERREKRNVDLREICEEQDITGLGKMQVSVFKKLCKDYHIPLKDESGAPFLDRFSQDIQMSKYISYYEYLNLAAGFDLRCKEKKASTARIALRSISLSLPPGHYPRATFANHLHNPTHALSNQQKRAVLQLLEVYPGGPIYWKDI